MQAENTKTRTWLILALLAVAMAWMEAATVVYVRTMFGRLEPYQPDPLPLDTKLGYMEIIRELATVVMLATAGSLAGRTARGRLGYFVIAFGIWDIFYYVFLAVIGPWPHSIADWDVLFLIPLPWWGPVWAPSSIALLMVIGGTLVARSELELRPIWPSPRAWMVSLGGALLALWIFMEDAILALPSGMHTVVRILPDSFPTPLFLIALGLMAAPIADMLIGPRELREAELAGVPAHEHS